MGPCKWWSCFTQEGGSIEVAPELGDGVGIYADPAGLHDLAGTTHAMSERHAQWRGQPCLAGPRPASMEHVSQPGAWRVARGAWRVARGRRLLPRGG